jgi:hypothetical protein
MTIGNAMKFIKQGIGDSELREQLNSARNIKERDEILFDEGLRFTHDQFEEAYRNLLTLCTEVDAADQLKEYKNWWELLTYLLEPGACSKGCNGCCPEQSA